MKNTDRPTDSSACFESNLEKYARLIVESGCNVQQGQELFLTASVETADFARLVTRIAYERGARHVTVRYTDEQISRMHYDHCDLAVFETMPEWAAMLNNSMAREGAAILSIISEDPEIMTGIDPAKAVANARASHLACREFYDALDFGRNVWCIAGAASSAWARKVFPGVSESEAVAKLWDAIFTTARIGDADPVAAWEEHRKSFAARTKLLNEQRFDALRYRNGAGTDFTVGLTDKHLWNGGGDTTQGGTPFFPNIPTEEVFTTPDRLRADGAVVSAMPLIHNGTLIDSFSITFRDGKAVDFSAEQGYDTLKSIIETDENSCRLGEVALVPFASPIRETGILFYNTLYDENASCHLALGQGFPDCYEGGTEMDAESLFEAGVNKSATHVDFMIGTEDLRIEGIKADGSVLPIFENGNWAGIFA